MAGGLGRSWDLALCVKNEKRLPRSEGCCLNRDSKPFKREGFLLFPPYDRDTAWPPHQPPHAGPAPPFTAARCFGEAPGDLLTLGTKANREAVPQGSHVLWPVPCGVTLSWEVWGDNQACEAPWQTLPETCQGEVRLDETPLRGTRVGMALGWPGRAMGTEMGQGWARTWPHRQGGQGCGEQHHCGWG